MTNVTQISTVAKASSSWLVNVQKVWYLQDWQQILIPINNYQRKITIQKAVVKVITIRISTRQFFYGKIFLGVWVSTWVLPYSWSRFWWFITKVLVKISKPEFSTSVQSMRLFVHLVGIDDTHYAHLFAFKMFWSWYFVMVSLSYSTDVYFKSVAISECKEIGQPCHFYCIFLFPLWWNFSFYKNDSYGEWL